MPINILQPECGCKGSDRNKPILNQNMFAQNIKSVLKKKIISKKDSCTGSYGLSSKLQKN